MQFWAQIYSIVQNELKFVKPLKGEEEILDILARFERMNPDYIEYKLVTTTEFKSMYSELSKYDSRQIGRVLTKLGVPEVSKKIHGQVVRMRKLPYPKNTIC